MVLRGELISGMAIYVYTILITKDINQVALKGINHRVEEAALQGSTPLSHDFEDR